MPHRDFLPDYVPKTGDKPLVIIFPGVQLRVKNPRIAERYPSERELVSKTLKETGTVEDVQTKLAVTGFLVPWVPHLLGFKVFGKGGGGILKCSLAGVALGLYASTYTSQVNSIKWKHLDSSNTLTKSQRRILRFHLSEMNRIKQQVLRTVGCQPPQPPQALAPGLLRKWIYKTQWEMWRWRYWWNIVYWPDEMERAWREAFVEEEFQKTTVGNWSKYLEIKRGLSGGPNVPVVSFFIHKNVFHDLKENPPGQIVRSAAWNLLSKEMQQKYARIIMDNCKPAFTDHLDIVERQRRLQKVAEEYLRGGTALKSIDQLREVAAVSSADESTWKGVAVEGQGPVPSPVTPRSYLNPQMDAWLETRANTGAIGNTMMRDFEFERAFAKEYKYVSRLFQRTTLEVHYCEEWFKVITGEFPNRYFGGQGAGDKERAARHVLRMAETWENEEKNGVQSSSRDIPQAVPLKEIQINGTGEKSDGIGRKEQGKDNGAADVVESLSVQQKSVDIPDHRTETAAQPVTTSPSSSSSGVGSGEERKEKKSITEAKKSSEEKGKQESGVENS